MTGISFDKFSSTVRPAVNSRVSQSNFCFSGVALASATGVCGVDGVSTGTVGVIFGALDSISSSSFFTKSSTCFLAMYFSAFPYTVNPIATSLSLLHLITSSTFISPFPRTTISFPLR